MVTSTKNGIVGKLKNAISGLFGSHGKTSADKTAEHAGAAKKMPVKKAVAQAKSAAAKTADAAATGVKKVGAKTSRKPAGAARKRSPKKR